MRQFLKVLIGFVGVLALPLTSHAQFDEIIVTATRLYNSASPGVFLEKRGSFLLLEARMVNDTRNPVTRRKEMNVTFDRILKAAKQNPDVELSLVDDNDFVVPLTKDVFNANIFSGSRPDTSAAKILLKTKIPEDSVDAFPLLTKLEKFVEKIDDASSEVDGRTNFDETGETSISVVDPYQYRGELMKHIMDEINFVTEGLNGEYVAHIKGLSEELDWSRFGELGLAFYIAYSYEVLPKSLHAITILE